MAATFAGDKSMRVNYVQGVDTYYQTTGGEYRNPHFSGIVLASQGTLEAWWSAAPALAQLPEVRVLDLACGSGEATQALERWWASGKGVEARRRGPRGLQPAAARHHAPEPHHAPPGPEPEASGAEPGPAPPLPAPAPQPCALDQAPDEAAVQWDTSEASNPPSEQPTASSGTAAVQPSAHPAASSATAAVQSSEQLEQSSSTAAEQSGNTASPGTAAVQPSSATGRRPPLHVDACDPYTYDAFEKWTGRRAERWAFQDIADGCLADRHYHLCICSYALHVLDDSKLFSLLMQLSLVTQHLIVLSPHKKPQIGAHTGWQLLQHDVVERVHAWLYETLNAQQ